MKLLILLLCLSGCAAWQKPLAEAIIPAFRAEAAAVKALSDLDEQVITHSTSLEQLQDWKKKHEAIMTGLKLFHEALSAVGAILLSR